MINVNRHSTRSRFHCSLLDLPRLLAIVFLCVRCFDSKAAQDLTRDGSEPNPYDALKARLGVVIDTADSDGVKVSRTNQFTPAELALYFAGDAKDKIVVPASVVERGADFRIIQTVTTSEAVDGSVVLKTNQFKITGAAFEGEGLLPGVQSFVSQPPTLVASDATSRTLETVTQYIGQDGSVTSKRETFMEFDSEEALNAVLARPPEVLERGSHHRVVHAQNPERISALKLKLNPASYTELETGMAYQDEPGVWQNSLPGFEIVNGGVVARRTPHKVSLGSSPTDDNPVDITLPNGARLRSRVLGLGYFDRASGKSVVIAEIQNSQGELSGDGTTVTYPLAFNNVTASLRYVLSKAGLEQDVILDSQPPDPEDFGLDSASSQLEVITEFFPEAEPRVTSQSLHKPSNGLNGATQADGDLVDDTIDFGPMQMGYGRAFELKNKDQSSRDEDVAMTKRWLKTEGRTILFEAAQMPDLKPLLEKLPKVKKTQSKPPREASLKRQLPRVVALNKPVQKNSIKLAKAGYQAGLVLDYALLGNSANFTFLNGTTYLVNGTVYLTGTTTIQGGAVVKYQPNAIVQMTGQVVGPANGLTAYFVAGNDNSVGEQINSGAPVGYSAATALWLYNVSNAFTLANVEIRNASKAVEDNAPGISPTPTHTFSSSRWVDCNTGVRGTYINVTISASLTACNVQTLTNNGGNANFSVGPYSSSCTFCAGDDYGNTIASAAALSVGSSLAGTINCAGDEDFFAFTVGGTTTLSIYTTGTTDTYGHLLNGSGAELASDDNSGNLSNFRISYTFSPGTYYIRVRHTTGGTGAYKLAINIPSSWTPLVSRVNSLGYYRTDFPGSVGFQFAVGGTPISVKELGRWILNANNQNHTLTLYDSIGVAVPNGQVTLSASGQPIDQFAYAALSTPVTLAANTTYTLMSSEVPNSDAWLDYGGTVITLNSAANNPWAAWAYPASAINLVGGGSGRAYVPLDLRYGAAPANTPPTISGLGSQTMNEDSSLAGLSVTIGDAETAASSLTLAGSAVNTTLFPPGSIVCGGTGTARNVTLNPALNQNGTTTITLTVGDGTTTTSTTFSVTVTAVNDRPSFTPGSSVTVNEDSGAYSAGWAINRSAGPADEATQALNFVVSGNSIPGLFSAGPAIDSFGTLTFTTAPNASGSSTITVYLHDNGGIANGGLDTSTPPATFTITLVPQAQTPVLSSSFNSDHSSDTVSGTSNGQVHYTVNGLDPDINSSTTPPSFGVPTTVKARAYGSGLAPSDVATLVVGTTVSVSFTPNGHNPIEYSNGPLPVQMTAESGATVWYKAGTSGNWLSTTSGSSPSIDGIDSGNGTIQAYAYTGSKLRSGVTTSGQFSFRVPQPTSTASYPSFTSGTLTLNDSVSGATIRYTTDGVTTPTASSATYSSPLTFSTPTKVLARAYKSGYLPSGYISAWLNQLPSARVATSSGVLSGNITVNNDLDVWLLPNFGFDNLYGETANMTGWSSYGAAWNSDIPNVNFLGSFANNSSSGEMDSAAAIPVSFGHTYTLGGWFRKTAAGGGDYAGVVNYAETGSFIGADDVNEGGNGVTYLTQTLTDGATTAQVANGALFASPPPEWYFDLFVPLINFAPSAEIQKINQPNSLGSLFQYLDLNQTTVLKATVVNGNQITFSVAYHGPTLPIGTPVGRRNAGSTYQYQLLAYTDLPLNWTYYSTSFNYFRSGTDTIRLLCLLYSGNMRLTGYEMWEGSLGDRPKLYYTLNGSAAVYAQTGVSGPLKLTLHGNQEGTINLGQRGTYYIDASVQQRVITFKVATPNVSATPIGAQTLFTVSDATIGAEIRYTTDGSDPTTGSILFNNSVTLANGLIPRWKAFKTNYLPSDTVLSDSDGDGLADWWEIQYFGNLSQTGAGDYEGDGLSNVQEYLAGTNPGNPDTDGDGVPDGTEVSRSSNPLVKQADLILNSPANK
jgi:hypothetical protein